MQGEGERHRERGEGGVIESVRHTQRDRDACEGTDAAHEREGYKGRDRAAGNQKPM